MNDLGNEKSEFSNWIRKKGGKMEFLSFYLLNFFLQRMAIFTSLTRSLLVQFSRPEQSFCFDNFDSCLVDDVISNNHGS